MLTRTVITRLQSYEGDIVRVLHFKNGWYYVEYDKGCYAYIHNSRVILQ